MLDCRSAAIKPATRPLRDNRTATIMPTPRPPDSHPDRRCSLIQIAAQQPNFIRARAEQLRADTGLLNNVRNSWPANAPDTELRLRIGPMVSGSAVLADQDVLDRIIEQHRNLTAVEMESYGVLAAAAFASHPRPTAFVCKAVCGFADDEKNDRWQSYAAFTSVQVLRAFFEGHMSEIRDFAGAR